MRTLIYIVLTAVTLFAVFINLIFGVKVLPPLNRIQHAAFFSLRPYTTHANDGLFARACVLHLVFFCSFHAPNPKPGSSRPSFPLPVTPSSWSPSPSL